MMKNGIKRMIAAVLTAASALTAFASCAEKETAEKTVLTNKMSESELAAAQQTELMLLDRPWEQYLLGDLPAPPVDGFFEGIFYSTITRDDLLSDLEENREEYDDPDEVYEEFLALAEDYEKINGLIVRGELYFNFLPPFGYDGGAGETTSLHYDVEAGTNEVVTLQFDDLEQFKELLREDLDDQVEKGLMMADRADMTYEDIVDAYEAIVDGSAVKITSQQKDQCLDYSYENYAQIRQMDRSSQAYTWEMDPAAVEAISGSIIEYHFRDDELDMGFTVHVITPHSYDPEKEYPALVMTDAVWRFNNVTSLWDLMGSGEAVPYIMITVGFDYDVDGWDNEVRAQIFCIHKKEFLDFLTDNLMPYLGGSYNFDYTESVLFGHSQGGIFSHYAAFNRDLYENRPFGRYIIGSPAFWTPYFTDAADYDDYSSEYGYFDRNGTADMDILITGGSLEDEDYEEYYGSNDSTLEGIQHLSERLAAHGMETFEVRIYESHHYQYVPQLLAEYVTAADQT